MSRRLPALDRGLAKRQRLPALDLDVGMRRLLFHPRERGLANPRSGLAKPRSGLAKPRSGLAKPRSGLAKPRRAFAIERGFADARRFNAVARGLAVGRGLADWRRAVADFGGITRVDSAVATAQLRRERSVCDGTRGIGRIPGDRLPVTWRL